MATTEKKPTPTKVVTGTVRFSYAHVFKPHAVDDDQEEKYGVALIIPKSDTATMARINAAIAAAKEEGKAKLSGKKNPKLPIRDGDEERPDDDAYKNAWFINANAKTKPGVVDKDLNPIIDQDEFYSGCYGRASITFYAFDAKGNKGIACGLNNVQKLKDGEFLGGRSTPEADFGDLDFEDEGAGEDADSLL